MNTALHLCGPFLSASVAIMQFGQNIYQATMLDEAIDMYTEYEIKLQNAVENEDDEAYIASLKAESDYYDQIFKISLAGILSIEEA